MNHEELRQKVKDEFQSNNFYAESATRDDVAHPGRLYVTKKDRGADSHELAEHLDFASEKHIDAIMALFNKALEGNQKPRKYVNAALGTRISCACDTCSGFCGCSLPGHHVLSTNGDAVGGMK